MVPTARQVPHICFHSDSSPCGMIANDYPVVVDTFRDKAPTTSPVVDLMIVLNPRPFVLGPKKYLPFYKSYLWVMILSILVSSLPT